MPRKPPPRWEKGSRPPGSGRVKGAPNRITVEVRELVSQLMNDVAYQHKLRDDFRRRKVHPSVEALIWTYHLGKPKQTIDLNAAADLNIAARVEEERRAFALLDIREMETLAAASQELVDRVLALSRARIAASPMPQPRVIESEQKNESRKST